MNKHFRDAWYYARRAGEHLARGAREELEPVERRVRAATGRERDETTRTEKWRDGLEATEAKAERRVRGAVRRARKRV
ncbi:DUF7553 family protein [Halorussus amylolyticus]|uniref:DUF7553 family protein n=1 Tax=Halorussus amylolyticus TaxID=1126242 RepID=UPI00104C0157|nr:hypothetical protein [Halorussus amylolyticus]